MEVRDLFADDVEVLFRWDDSEADRSRFRLFGLGGLTHLFIVGCVKHFVVGCIELAASRLSWLYMVARCLCLSVSSLSAFSIAFLRVYPSCSVCRLSVFRLFCLCLVASSIACLRLS